MTYKKLIQHDVLEARHDLTRLLKLDMWQMKNAKKTEIINHYSGHMYGIVEAYWHMGIIDMCARSRYIIVINDNEYKQYNRLLGI